MLSEEDAMPSTHATAGHQADQQHDLRELIREIVYARVLLELDRATLGKHDRPLRLALREALEQLAPTDDERQRIAEEALEAAWARVASEVRLSPRRKGRGPIATAA